MADDITILQYFDPISLDEMDKVKLMNRTDTKFSFNRNKFEEIMSEVLSEYKILEVEGKRLSRYKTLYYDTEDYTLYRQHHNGKLNRYKVRHRTYVETHAGYLEVKFKNNKGRTIKDRIKKKDVPIDWDGEEEVFLHQKVPFEPEILKPVIWVNYSRLTLVNKNDAERLTVDLDIEFVKSSENKKINALVIAEVKQEKRKPSPFIRIMKKLHIREGGISKYCLGMALTCNEVKKNNFKRKLLTLKHIIDDNSVAGGK